TTFDTTYSGVLGAGSVATALTKAGRSTLTLSGHNLYTGATAISGGVLKLGSAGALGASSGVTVSSGGVLDLNGCATSRNLTVSGAGMNGGGALYNNAGTTSTLRGTVAVALGSKVRGVGNITISNGTGVTGNFVLNKVGNGTLTIISTGTSARTGV